MVESVLAEVEVVAEEDDDDKVAREGEGDENKGRSLGEKKNDERALRMDSIGAASRA